MILIVFALPEESSDFRRALRASESSGHGVALRARGTLGKHPYTVAHTGMGAVAAERALRELIAAERPTLVIGSGFAGGVQPGVPHGQVIAEWRGPAEAAPDLAAHARLGRFTTAHGAVETPAEKAALGRQTGADAVEMEGAAAAAVCAEHHLPYLIVRAISDPVTAPLPVPMPHWFDLERQRPRPGALLLFLARNPGRLLPFIRFVRGLAVPRAALAQSLMGILRDLP